MNPTNYVFMSEYGIDKILSIFSGSFTAASRPSLPAIGASFASGINDLVFCQGTFTVDGGNPQDLGSELLVNGFYVQALAGSQSNNINIYYNNDDTVAHTITYNVFMISKPSNGLFTPGNLPANSDYFNSNDNYQKIDIDGEESISVSAATGNGPTDTVITIAHNLGYMPCVRAFVDDGTTLTDVLVRNSPALVYNRGVLMTNTVDNSNVYFRFTNLDSATYSFNLSYRIYYDAN